MQTSEDNAERFPEPVRSGGTIMVAFSNPDEFLEELRDRAPNVEPVLRLTFRWTPDQSGAPLSGLWLVANYLRRVDPGTLAIVRLDHFVGDVWQDIPDAGSEHTRQRAEQLRNKVRQAAEAQGLEVRGGAHLPQLLDGKVGPR